MPIFAIIADVDGRAAIVIAAAQAIALPARSFSVLAILLSVGGLGIGAPMIPLTLAAEL